MAEDTKVFPAYAGVNLDKKQISKAVRGIPRVCGGEPSLDALLGDI